MNKQERQKSFVRRHLFPLLNKYGLQVPVADFGSGQGHVLAELREACIEENGAIEFSCTGIETNNESRRAAERNHPGIRFVMFEDQGEQFGTVLACDVVEHAWAGLVMDRLADLLQPGGRLYVSFPPWRSPFGGHQQTCRSWLRFVPWAHVVARWATLRRLFQTARNADDIWSVFTNRVGGRDVKEAATTAGLHLLHEAAYFARPERGRAVRAPRWFPDLFVAGREYIYTKG